jgi:hypothetical protein
MAAREKPQACQTLSRPEAVAREAVRGLAASMRASMARLAPMAKTRAPAMATLIQRRLCGVGSPPEARSSVR